MPSNSRHPDAHVTNLRRQIASAAARLMAEEGIEDYAFAKRKAARQLGCSDSHILPNNREIEEALKDYLAVYQAEEQPAALRALRAAALAAMRYLEAFSPYLTGGVLAGTAGRFSTIELELYPDSAKEVEIFLLGRNMDFEHLAVRRRADSAAPEAILDVAWGDEAVRLMIFHRTQERSLRRSPHTGQIHERASIEAVERLLGDPQ